MAVSNINVYNKSNDGMALPLSISRGNPNPLDDTFLHKDLASAQAYAQSDPVAYVGQIIGVHESKTLDDGTTQNYIGVYVIDDIMGTLRSLGGSDSSSVLQAIADLKKDIGDIKTDVGTLQTDVGTMQTDIGTLQTDVGTMQTDIGTLQTDVGTLQSDVSTLQTDIGNIQTDINTVKGDVATLQTDVGTLQTDVGGIKTDIGTIQTDIGTLQTDVGDINTKLGTGTLPNGSTDIIKAINDINDKVGSGGSSTPPDDEWATEADVDSLYSGIFSGLGW